MDPEPRSTTGLEPRLAGALCYLLGFISGVVFLVVEKEDAEVRFHAYQSVGVFGALFAVSVAANVVPVIGVLLSFVLAPLSVILWLVLLFKTFQGQRVELPVVGEWAAQQARLP